MLLRTLELVDFRTYPQLRLELPEQGAVFRGPNGSGKTNLLEAVHLLCTGRSQRSASRAEMIRHDSAAASVRGTFLSQSGEVTESQYGFDRDGAVRMSRNGTALTSQRQWYGACAVVPFGPEDIRMLVGPPSERRRFMDMLIGQYDSRYLQQLVLYNRALAHRNRSLGSGEPRLLDIYEEQMVRHGSYVHEQRCRLVDFCQDKMADYYGRISSETAAGRLRFASGAGARNDGGQGWGDVFSNTLKNNRKRDAELGYSTQGSHRDDLHILLDKWHARTFASQGQLRSLALALRLCAVQALEQWRGGPLVLLVDDAFSELDDTRIARVYPLIRERGQVLMATPVNRIPDSLGIPQYSVQNGTVSAL